MLRRRTTMTELSDDGQQEDEQREHLNTQVSSIYATQQVEATIETEDELSAPLLLERKRQYFSYDASELQRKTSTSSSNVKAKVMSSGTTHSQHSTASGDEDFMSATYAQWLNTQSRNPICPVCKAGCGKDKVIPVYGRGRQQKDPRDDPSIPTRPAGQRPPPLQDPNRPRTSFFGQNNWGSTSTTYNSHNVSFSGGIGFFPFGISFVSSDDDCRTCELTSSFDNRTFPSMAIQPIFNPKISKMHSCQDYSSWFLV
ncbi:unnamed protein product [Absidia cylindrospora]